MPDVFLGLIGFGAVLLLGRWWWLHAHDSAPTYDDGDGYYYEYEETWYYED